jgi:zinc protease
VTRALIALLIVASMARADTRKDTRLRVEQFRLTNDLQVILAPDPSATAITVHLRHRFGSMQEETAESGFTYLLEQLLGMGSVHVRDFETQIDALGGWTTARTDNGHLGTTTYAPARALERVLWLEAERMAGLADGITEESLARGKDAVKAAWRAAHADVPYARIERELNAALWTGYGASYGNPIVGDGKTVARASLVDVRNFARRRLAPNTAILVVAGKLDASTRETVSRYFGWIPWRSPLGGGGGCCDTERVERIVADVEAKVLVAYACRPFDLQSEVIAHVLAGDRESRLHHSLVASGLATEVRAELVRHAMSELRIYAKPARGVDSRQVARAIRNEMVKLDVTADDIARVAPIIETNFYIGFENLPVRAELLAAWRADGRHGSVSIEEWIQGLRVLQPFSYRRQGWFIWGPVTIISRDAR